LVIELFCNRLDVSIADLTIGISGSHFPIPSRCDTCSGVQSVAPVLAALYFGTETSMALGSWAGKLGMSLDPWGTEGDSGSSLPSGSNNVAVHTSNLC